MVHPNYRGLKLARRLYDARKQLAREKNLMRIVVGGRIPGYAAARRQDDAPASTSKRSSTRRCSTRC